MTKQEIITHLRLNYEVFADHIATLDEARFMYADTGKWTPGQHIDHIYRSIKPINQGLVLPAWLLKWVFGKANRPSKTYDQLVAAYLKALQNGGKATGRFIPPPIPYSEKINLQNKVKNAASKLCSLLEKFSENQLDELIAPHPLLGKVTLRELMYFTIYHVQHHAQLTMGDNG